MPVSTRLNVDVARWKQSGLMPVHTCIAKCAWKGGYIYIYMPLEGILFRGCTSGEFMYLVFTRLPGESCRRRLRSLVLCLHDISRALINSFVEFSLINKLCSWLSTEELSTEEQVMWQSTLGLENADGHLHLQYSTITFELVCRLLYQQRPQALVRSYHWFGERERVCVCVHGCVCMGGWMCAWGWAGVCVCVHGQFFLHGFVCVCMCVCVHIH